jgi:hypothetical protein
VDGPLIGPNGTHTVNGEINLLSAPPGLNHFLNAARQAAAEVIVLDPLYSTHDQDENDTRRCWCVAPSGNWIFTWSGTWADWKPSLERVERL